jgi:TIR domain
MEADNIGEIIARWVLQNDVEFGTRIEIQDKGFPSSELSCTDPAVGRWIDGTNVEYLLSVLALDDKEFAVTFPALSGITTQQRRQFIARIESHLEVCLQCAHQRAHDLEFEKRLNHAVRVNRNMNETPSLELADSGLPLCEESSYKLFLSHSSRDKNIARQLAKDLEYLDVRVWFDEWNLEPGDSLHERIGEALEACNFVAVILSPNWHYSKWFTKEMYQALSREDRTRKKVVIPLMLGLDHAPPFLQDRLHLRLEDHHYYRSLAEIVATVESLDRKLLATAFETSLCTFGDVQSCLQAAGWKPLIEQDPKVFRSLMEFMKLPSGRRPKRFDIIARYGKTGDDDDDNIFPFRDTFKSC